MSPRLPALSDDSEGHDVVVGGGGYSSNDSNAPMLDSQLSTKDWAVAGNQNLPAQHRPQVTTSPSPSPGPVITGIDKVVTFSDIYFKLSL